MSSIPSLPPGDTRQFVRAPDDLVATPMRYPVPMRPAVLISWTPLRLLAAIADLLMPQPEPAAARIPVRKDHSV